MDELRISKVNITPTMRCNLKCKLCGVMAFQYEYRPHMTEDEYYNTIDMMFKLFTHVDRLQITGGEALLHIKLDEFIEKCFEYSNQFDEIWLFSNCAVPIRPAMQEVIIKHKDRIVIHCSDYGVRPEISENNMKFIMDNNIKHRYLKYYGENQYYDGWVDNGDFVAHNRSEEENKIIFSNCTHTRCGGSWYIRNGQIHWCGRSIRGTEVGRVPLNKDDYLDLFENIPIEEKREKFRKLMARETIAACDYCNGYYGTEDKSKRFPAGEQME